MRARRIAPSHPPRRGRRKIVLATSIAETSLTIEGVRVVIDSGLMRVPRYEPDIGLTRLETVRVSRANADQRRGRAGRVEPGVCYRLWEEAATGGLQPYAAPEILSADLSGFLLDCAVWGESRSDAARLSRSAAARRARRGARAARRRSARSTPTAASPTRAARSRASRCRRGSRAWWSTRRAQAKRARPPRSPSLLTERGLGGDAVDLTTRLEAFRRDRSPRADDARRLARGLARAGARGPHPAIGRLLPRGRRARPRSLGERGQGEGRSGALLASAYPDRIAMARGRRGEFLMANGRAAALEAHDALAGEPIWRSARSSAAPPRRASCSPRR